MEFRNFLEQIAQYLDKNYYCKKHKIEHTGKNAYALDFYMALGDMGKAKKLVFKIIDKAKEKDGHLVFYPGIFNHYNKSNNVIDCGAIIDSLSRFLYRHKDIFDKEELEKIEGVLDRVVNTYLVDAAVKKPITNQRLWGLTGLASYYHYKKDSNLLPIIKESIEVSLKEMTDDGFFIYHPHTDQVKNFPGYGGLTTYYQSRCTAFIYYAIEKSGLDLGLYQNKLEQSILALLSMYKQEGYKDLNLECKKWYWLSDYEIASHTFDVYALSKSTNPLAKQILLRSLHQIKNHIKNGYLHSHAGSNHNYQCNLFWNAHLAWVTRVGDIEKLWSLNIDQEPIDFEIKLDKVVNISHNSYQVILNKFWQERNYTVGIYGNGLPKECNKKFYKFSLLKPNKNVLFSIRETLYHCKVALRTFHLGEFFARLIKLSKGIFVSIMPVYQLKYGKVDNFVWDNNKLRFSIIPATKYGRLLDNKNCKVEILFDNQAYKIKSE
ncbi:hypothetical protein HON36_05815 [Candidatus Parcubacteria bacterium]|nr:hypothetical protein [Candidatus Parcubacteria bacterium]MBT7228658.1 hypothetical protein [Candidatus Parcubacteria bacterium]